MLGGSGVERSEHLVERALRSVDSIMLAFCARTLGCLLFGKSNSCRYCESGKIFLVRQHVSPACRSSPVSIDPGDWFLLLYRSKLPLGRRPMKWRIFWPCDTSSSATGFSRLAQASTKNVGKKFRDRYFTSMMNTTESYTHEMFSNYALYSRPPAAIH